MSPKPFATPSHRPRSVIHLAAHGRARIVAALSAATRTTLRNVAVLSRGNADFSGREQREEHKVSGMGVNWIQLGEIKKYRILKLWFNKYTYTTVCVFVPLGYKICSLMFPRYRWDIPNY